MSLIPDLRAAVVVGNSVDPAALGPSRVSTHDWSAFTDTSEAGVASTP